MGGQEAVVKFAGGESRIMTFYGGVPHQGEFIQLVGVTYWVRKRTYNVVRAQYVLEVQDEDAGRDADR